MDFNFISDRCLKNFEVNADKTDKKDNKIRKISVGKVFLKGGQLEYINEVGL